MAVEEKDVEIVSTQEAAEPTTLLAGEDAGSVEAPESAATEERPYGKFDDAAGLLRGYEELESLQGGSVRIPGEDSTPEEIEKFNGRMRPEKPDGYVLERPEDMPEGLEYNEGFARNFAEAAHANGLSKRQVDGLHKWWNTAQAETYTSNLHEANDAEKGLKAELGVKYPETIAHAKRVIAGIEDGEVRDAFLKTALGNHPGMIKFLAGVGARMGEGATVQGEGSPRSGASKEEVAGKIKEIYADPKHAYHGNSTTEGHREAVAEMTKLNVELAAINTAEEQASRAL
jgi:hypothetical protein